MTRISDRHLVQILDDEELVIIDESSGNEVVVPFDTAGRLCTVIFAFTRPTASPRTFHLVRDVDVTGISGTGIVAEGVEFTDGVVALRWTAPGIAEAHRDRGVRPTTVVHESVDSVLALHAHAGATHVEWLDER